MALSELAARQQMVKYSHMVHRAGLVTATDGNLSIRLDDRRILITPSSLRKEEMTVDAPVVMDYHGEVIEGEGRASSEKKIHIKAYQERPDIHAVIHAHPVHCIAITVAGVPLDTCLLPEMVVSLGAVPVAPYATPSTDELPASIEQYVRTSDIVMMERHGSLTMGKDLSTAFKLLEKLEQSAQISYMAMLLGGPRAFPPAELERLAGLRDFYGVSTQQVSCSLAATGRCARSAAGAASRADAAGSAAGGAPPGSDGEPARLSEAQIEAIVNEVVERVASAMRRG